MKRKLILSMVFIICLIPMLFYQYIALKEVQEISIFTKLFNPLSTASVILFFIGTWLPFKNKSISKTLETSGVLIILLAEIYTYSTHYPQIYEDVKNSTNSFFNFYFVFLISALLILLYLFIYKKLSKK
ncbi:MAG: hypothetical protein ACLUWN_01630 [Clostridia bacterium]